jgi:membrane-associated protease RseP (regulator of RpoE activity)
VSSFSELPPLPPEPDRPQLDRWTRPSWPDPSAFEPLPVIPAPRRRDRVWLHVLLFVLTLITTTLTGAAQYAGFLSNFDTRTVPLSASLIWDGLSYSLTILAILGCHEMGHYLACRYYRIDATLPFFIPVPGVLTGTFGAVIKIRQPILQKVPLFDIGIAGPIAGFVVAVPALFIGLLRSTTVPMPDHFSGLSLGEPLLFKAASWLVWGTPPDGMALNMHPMAFAAWFGLLATALNLFPIAQLDGGHISYAVFGKRATRITLAALAVASGLILVSYSWAFWTAMLFVMLFMVGAKHPPVIDEDQPLDRTRLWLAVFAAIMFILCFTPAPIEPLDLLK